MQFLKALIGGIIGGAIGSAVYFVLKPGDQFFIPWLSILAGLLSGIGVRLLCGSQRNVLTGIVAAVTTLVALLGWQYVADVRLAMTDPTIVSQPARIDHSKSNSAVAPAGAGDEKDAAGETSENDVETAETKNSSVTPGDDAKNDVEGTDATEANTDENKADGEPDKSPAVITEQKTPAAIPEPKQQPMYQTKVEAKLRNEGIAFGIATLLAYVLGTGTGRRKQESTISEPA